MGDRTVVVLHATNIYQKLCSCGYAVIIRFNRTDTVSNIT